ncbi:hypothetical protein CGRA01v4_05515 [Colletotrichum graminicola]|nr:hypothetical protein CGRA01v4_05515 [Colletotrichum graminicola]
MTDDRRRGSTSSPGFGTQLHYSLKGIDAENWRWDRAGEPRPYRDSV